MKAWFISLFRKPSGPTPQELEREAMPKSSTAGYFFPEVDGIYDGSSFDPELSDNKIDQEQIDFFIKHINQSGITPDRTFDNRKFVFLLLAMPILLAIIFGLLLYISYPTKAGIYVTLPILIAIIAWVALFALIYYKNTRQKKEHTRLLYLMFDEHKATTFENIPLNIIMPPFRTYINIEFAWRDGVSLKGSQKTPKNNSEPLESEGVALASPEDNKPQFVDPSTKYQDLAQEPAEFGQSPSKPELATMAPAPMYSANKA